MLRDLIIAWRSLRRSPEFTLIAVATLSLGIGANATIFSVVNSVLLRPLDGFETHRLLRIQDATRTAGLGFVAPEAYQRIRAEAKSFDHIAGMQFCQFALTGEGEPEMAWGPCVTANWFEVQRAQAMLGRTFLPNEDLPGRNKVVVLDYGFWQRRFGGARDIIGRTITLDREPWLVIGVMPPSFRPVGVNAAAIFTPYVLDDNAASLYVTARVKPGVTIGNARAELRVVEKHLQSVDPRFKDLALRATPVLEDITGPVAPLLQLLLGAVTLVLLIACVNVANLLIARSAARQRELDIRIALGAPRWRLVRFLFAEAFLLCSAASLAAVAIAHFGLRLARPMLATVPRSEEVAVDIRVFVACLLIGLLTAMIFGCLPVLLPGRKARRWQGTLVAAEVALSFVLLAGAGLFLRTFAAMRAADLGYDPQNVLTYFFSISPSADGSRTGGLALYARIRESLSRLPGVVDVATSTTFPTGGVMMTMDVQPDGQPAPRRSSSTRQASLVIVSDNYFRTARIPLRAGRTFDSGDREGSTPVVIVSESIANRYFDGHATGRRIVLPRIGFNLTGGEDLRVEIVGVAGNVCVNSVSDCEVEHIYLPESQNGLRMSYFLIRTASMTDPMSLAAAVKRAAAVESPLFPLDQPQTLEQRAGYLTGNTRQGMWFVGIFAALAAVLAASGVYGVSTYLAGLRRKEIGIRVALGATYGDIASLIYGQMLRMAALGLALGVIAALGLARFVEAMLYRVGPRDPATLAVALTAALAIVVLAATPPALRSARADCIAELRRD